MLRADKMDIESTKLLQYLVDRNPDYLANNESKLFELSEKGKFSLLEAFIKIGANVHAKRMPKARVFWMFLVRMLEATWLMKKSGPSSWRK